MSVAAGIPGTPAASAPAPRGSRRRAPATGRAGRPGSGGAARGLLDGLGLVGLGEIEPIVVAAVAAELPILLVGPHGTGKSLLLTRVAAALGLEWRHYNASLLSYDDLVGYPVPDGRGGLDWLRTPATIWEAEAVFLDEINRCRPDLQNKLFPIVHERRIQGIPLERLRHRWSAMNPVSGGDDLGYLGAEALDEALADRFAFIVPMPTWRSLDADDQERLLASELRPVDPRAAAAFRAAVAGARERYEAALATGTAAGVRYVRHALALLHEAGITCSARRGTLMVRALAAVQATALLAPGDAAALVLRTSLPQRATGAEIDEGKVLLAHREALAAAAAAAEDPRLRILAIPDPLDRLVAALEEPTLDLHVRSGIVADAWADLAPGVRHAAGLHAVEAELIEGLHAAVASPIADAFVVVTTPREVDARVGAGSGRHDAWLEVKRVVAGLEASGPDDRESALLENLLVALWDEEDLISEEDVAEVRDAWVAARARIASRVPRRRGSGASRGRGTAGSASRTRTAARAARP